MIPLHATKTSVYLFDLCDIDFSVYNFFLWYFPGKVFCSVCNKRCKGDTLKIEERFIHHKCFQCASESILHLRDSTPPFLFSYHKNVKKICRKEGFSYESNVSIARTIIRAHLVSLVKPVMPMSKAKLWRFLGKHFTRTVSGAVHVGTFCSRYAVLHLCAALFTYPSFLSLYHLGSGLLLACYR